MMACAATGLLHGADTAIRCGKLLDVRSGELKSGLTVVSHDGTIRDVMSSSPAGIAVIDFSAYTCLPGLIDVHDHLTSDPTDSGYSSLGVSIPRQTVKGVKNARITLLAGFTTVRNVGADGFSDVALRDGINAGDVIGPRLLVSGPALGITGGHCDNNLLAPEFHYTAPSVADGPWAARTKVREVIKFGADLIKICASGGVLSKGDSPGAPQYSLEEMQAIVTEAHKLGRKVAAHAHGTQSIKDAIRAGVDSIEHSSLIDDEGIALAKQHHTYLVFDTYNHEFIMQHGIEVGMLPESIEKESHVGPMQYENFQHAYKLGAPMAFGTDGGVYPHGENARQFALMTKLGMKPIDAIRAATMNAAELLGWADRVGALEPGHFADLIAVDGDPLSNVSTLEHVRAVVKNGELVK